MHLHASAAFAAGLELVFIPFSGFTSSALCFLDGWWIGGLVMRIFTISCWTDYGYDDTCLLALRIVYMYYSRFAAKNGKS
jgi:hypothetical protein